MLIDWLNRQIAWSGRTFGPGPRPKGVVAHIRKELAEIEAAPGDLYEWIDVVILAFDGAWRAGFTAEQVAAALEDKLVRNMARKWPSIPPQDQPIEHIR